MPKNTMALSSIADPIFNLKLEDPLKTIELLPLPVIAPCKLRAVQATTFMKFDENKKLVYSDIYKRGQEVTNPQKINDILDSQQHHHFRKVQLGAD